MKVAGAGVVVTGGASGLGHGVVQVLAERGARVVVLDLPGSDGAELVDAMGGDHWFEPCDVTIAADVAGAVERAHAHLGRIDCLVNCAGILRARRVLRGDGSLHDLELFRRHLDVNVVGTFDVLRNVVAFMREQSAGCEGERGVVVNVSSIAAFEGQIGQTAYAASKGAVAAMTLPLARELGDVGVRVVSVAPGTMDTPMLGTLDDERRSDFAAANAFPKRLGAPRELGALVASVMEHVFLNGETIRFDAGLRMAPS